MADGSAECFLGEHLSKSVCLIWIVELPAEVAMRLLNIARS